MIKSFLHSKILNELTSILPIYPEYISVDKFASKELHFKYLNQLPKKPVILEQNVHFVKKRESVHIAIAVASILARCAFVEYIDHSKGASVKVDNCAKEIVEKHGEAIFKDLCK